MLMRKPRYDPEPVFRLYFNHGGDINSLVKDDKCPIKNYPNLYYFCKRHGFEQREEEIREIARKITDERIAEGLVIYKKAILEICTQMMLVYMQDLDRSDRRVTVADLWVAWKIYKREIGEFLLREQY